MKRIEFKVGQKVVALTTRGSDSGFVRQPISKGKVYTVKSVSYSPCCGGQNINVLNVMASSVTTSNYSRCACGERYLDGVDYLETRSTCFAPLDNLHESISEAAQNEDYELAQLLTEVLTENVELTELGI